MIDPSVKIAGSLVEIDEIVAQIKEAINAGRFADAGIDCQLLHLTAQRLRLLAEHQHAAQLAWRAIYDAEHQDAATRR